MTHEVYVIVVSGDRTQQIDAGGIGAVDLTRGIKGGEEAEGTTEEAVSQRTCVNVQPGDLSFEVDAGGRRTLV